MLPNRLRAPDEHVNWRSSLPFLAFHLVPLLVVVTGVTVRAVVLAVVLYALRGFAITAGYHRYFAHRSYTMRRVPQFVMAVVGLTAVQKGPLWWASWHRDHHRYADTDRDPHSPMKGFWWAHIGWIMTPKYGPYDESKIQDFARFPELRWLTSHDWVGPWGLAVVCFLIAGWPGVVVGFFASTVLLWHATFSVNSFGHIVGRRRYLTTDTSRNSWWIALITFGEGWHNNHHHFPASARQGFRWWEYDVSYWVLRVMSALHIVGPLRKPTPAALSARQAKTGDLDVGLFRLHLAQAAQAATGKAPELVDALEATADEAARRASAERVGAATRPLADSTA